jgi:hypothetical protein
MGGACRTHARSYKLIQNVDRKLEGKRPLDRPKRGWIGNIKLNLKETICDDMDWIHLNYGGLL